MDKQNRLISFVGNRLFQRMAIPVTPGQEDSLAGEPEDIIVVLIQDDALGAMIALAENV